MSNRAWMPLHIADYLADTGHLTAAEHGAYLLLIMHYWQNGALPGNEKMIARIAKLSADQWEDSRDILAMLFGPDWTHKRIDAELSKADGIIEKRRAAAEARYAGKTKSTSDANAVHVDSNCSDTGVPPTTINLDSSLRSESNLRESASAGNSDFKDWFSSWPSFASDDERSTLEEWGKLSQADRKAAVSNTEAYVAAAAKGGRKTICAANRYLRERRWERLNTPKKAQAPPPTAAEKEAARAEYRRKLIEQNNSW